MKRPELTDIAAWVGVLAIAIVVLSLAAMFAALAASIWQAVL